MARINPMFRSDYSRFRERIERRYKRYGAERRLRRSGLGFFRTRAQVKADMRAANVPEYAELDGGTERL